MSDGLRPAKLEEVFVETQLLSETAAFRVKDAAAPHTEAPPMCKRQGWQRNSDPAYSIQIIHLIICHFIQIGVQHVLHATILVMWMNIIHQNSLNTEAHFIGTR